MKLLSRLVWTPLHLAWSSVALLVLIATRRGGVMVFTHYHDIDDDRDQQMGPLVDALLAHGGRVIELTLIPFGLALVRNLFVKKRLFVSQTAILAVAWLMGLRSEAQTKRSRVAVARWFLRALRPWILFVIDESGSGQPLLRAARRLGIPVVAIQHGDFAGNPQYSPGRNGSFDTEPADLLCVWSSWFQDRLLAVSPIYTRDNTVVTGRLRYPEPEERHKTVDGLRVLILGEPDPVFRSELRPFLEALARGGTVPFYRPHPADTDSPRGGNRASLTEWILSSDVVLGSGSSGLLEALYWRRPVVVFCTPALDDPAGFVRGGLAIRCGDPEELTQICRRLEHQAGGAAVETARAMVWGETDADPIERILASAKGLGGPSRQPDV